MGVDYDDIDIQADGDAADRSQAISGRTSTPVILFPDSSHQVEPTDAQLQEKLASLGIV